MIMIFWEGVKQGHGTHSEAKERRKAYGKVTDLCYGDKINNLIVKLKFIRVTVAIVGLLHHAGQIEAIN